MKLPAFLILALALFLRLWVLDVRPPHFDEGVNGLFVDGMRAVPVYRYDPGNYHGPLHFYVLFASQQLFGRGVWGSRLPVALAGVAAVAAVFLFGRFFHRRVVLVAAAALAVSPAMVYYSRYAIHEMWLPLFSMLAVYGGLGLASREKRRSDLWWLGSGVTGLLLTKETWMVHAVAAAMAAGVARSTGVPPVGPLGVSPDVAGETPASPTGETPVLRRDVLFVVGACVAALVTFYSGLFMYPRGVLGIFETLPAMLAKGWSASEEGHHGEMFYYLKLLFHYEWVVLLGFVLALFFTLPRSWKIGAALVLVGVCTAVGGLFFTLGNPQMSEPLHRVEPFIKIGGMNISDVTSLGFVAVFAGAFFFISRPVEDRALRFIGLLGLAGLAGYSLISYKTPWCVVPLLWPFCFLFGHALHLVTPHSDGRLVAVLAGVFGVNSLLDVHRVCFKDPTDGREPFVYVQQLRDIEELMRPLNALVRHQPWQRLLSGSVVFHPQEVHPLPWLVGDFPNVHMQSHRGMATVGDADFLVVHEDAVPYVESVLLDVYYRSRFRTYVPDSEHRVYLRARTFRDVMPQGREPEFHRRVPLE